VAAPVERPAAPMSEPPVVALVRALYDPVAALVAARRGTGDAVDDAFLGLYVGDAEVDALLAARGTPRAGEVPVATGGLDALAAAFGLSDLDVRLLVVALAPDVDPAFERLYACLNDDVSRRRASAGLALALCGADAAAGAARARLGPAGPLVARRLVHVDDADRPFLTRAVRPADRVVAHLLGDPAYDPAVAVALGEPPVPLDVLPGLAKGLAGGVRLAYVEEGPGTAGRAGAAAAIEAAGLAVLPLDLARVADPSECAALVAREALLTGAALLAGPVDPSLPYAVRAFAEQACVTVLYGRATWDPAWSREVPLAVRAPVPDTAERAALWRTLAGTDLADPPGDEVVLSPEAMRRAVAAARLGGGTPDRAALVAGARAQNGAALERLARRVRPAVSLDDVVLDAETRTQLEHVAVRARHRLRVVGEWGMRPGGGRGHGVTALFTGEPGTGKTTSAEALAHCLGLDLYVVDLSRVVDKYVGETEKNLERVFDEAEGVNGVLLFDEADALFGRRSPVGDAHDRHANIEVAYLLQRMESFDGLAVLATNLRGNVDEAFLRRLDAIVDFAPPGVAARADLWRRCLGRVPRDDVDVDLLAERFDLSGGGIRAAAVTAAYGAAAGGVPVTTEALVAAARAEYRKLGRLVTGLPALTPG
jgi:hypothetical protein